ncbi:MAG TPA: cytochrome c biogenesis protein CcdA [Chitinophagaceae bacterium]|nr:cytochrome c biogenesis protein CcdA [Chitinophagaceae bacterium]
MPHLKKITLLVASFLLVQLCCVAQDSAAVFNWNVRSKKVNAATYEISFSTPGVTGWQLYAPNQVLSDVPTTTLDFADSAIQAKDAFADSGSVKKIKSVIFDGASVNVFEKPTTFRQVISIQGSVPATLQGKLLYSFGRGDEFYQNELPFTVSLEGGVAATSRILIPSINVKAPVADCGDDEAAGKTLGSIFLLGLVGGLIALITPCVFPLIPLTVSFFTKKSGTRQRGVTNALLYGFFIFAIYALLSLPFHLLDKTDPEILNNISTSVTLNLIFFAVFIVFAISFFGFFEIGLPASFANTIDSRSGIGNKAGIFFMALTLAIVSFSCTGPILGSLLAGALTNNGGAIQLTAGMSGFGLGLALPFVLFALFPNWLQSLPRSGGWLTSVKVVFGFIELAMAVKFLSNADLVKQWHILPREVFIAIWIVIGAATVLYLLGVLRFPHDSKPKMSTTRWVFVALFAAATLYLIPGVTNTKAANLSLISGFPPPLCYSMYNEPVNCARNIEPLKNDYEEALRQSKQFQKPILVDFTGWACVNCRRMEEKVWTDAEVARMMKEDFIVVSLYVDERKNLPATQQQEYTTKMGDKKSIITVGDQWATFQAENFYAVAQPQYAIISPDEKALTRTKAYTPDPAEFKAWLQCGLDAYRKNTQAR